MMQAGVITLTILGNKCDMAKQQAVPEEEARSYAESIGAQHHYVSAKTGEGISASVRQTVHRVLQHRSTQAQQQPQSYMPGEPALTDHKAPSWPCCSVLTCVLVTSSMQKVWLGCVEPQTKG